METGRKTGGLPESPHIAIIQLGRIGDMILLTPVFREAKRNCPGARLTVIAGRHNAAIAAANENVDRVIIFEKSPFKLLAFLRQLRKDKFDVYIDPKDHESTEGGMIARRAKADRKIGYEKNDVFDTPLPHKGEISLHYTDNALAVLQIFGMEINDNKPQLFVKEDSERYVREYYKDILKKKIIINISASSEKKMWPNEKWKVLIENIDARIYDISISFAPSEKERAEALAAMVRGVRLFRSRSLDDTVSLVKACDAVITPDTAVVHISAAFDKPLLTLYSWVPGFIEKFHPLNSNYIMIKTARGEDGIKSIGIEEAIEGWKELEAKFL